MLDLSLATVGLVLLAPAFAVIGYLIRREDGGSVFYRPTRVGLRGRLFRLWKFRTMVADAAQIGGPLTVGSDPRVTPVGVTLRRYKLDELPQLINVVLGEMSLVGPRPEAPELAALYTLDQRRVLELVPGITDPASIEYANESELLGTGDDPLAYYVAEVMPEKIRINLAYAERSTLLTDLGVILRTVLRISCE